VLSHPPYTPDLAPADFFISLIKNCDERMRFEAVSSIQQTVTRELKAIREEAFFRAFDWLYERYKRCAEAGGDYIKCSY
jgi:deoxyribose-phosphate aldolase